MRRLINRLRPGRQPQTIKERAESLGAEVVAAEKAARHERTRDMLQKLGAATLAQQQAGIQHPDARLPRKALPEFPPDSIQKRLDDLRVKLIGAAEAQSQDGDVSLKHVDVYFGQPTGVEVSRESRRSLFDKNPLRSLDTDYRQGTPTAIRSVTFQQGHRGSLVVTIEGGIGGTSKSTTTDRLEFDRYKGTFEAEGSSVGHAQYGDVVRNPVDKTAEYMGPRVEALTALLETLQPQQAGGLGQTAEG